MARYALVVGIAKYDNFRHLDKAATDAAAIARILQTHGQYQVEPLPKRLVESENRWELAPDRKVTGKELGQVLETFLLERAQGQEALIYFAGHGFEVPGLGSKKKGYLATSDGTSDGRNALLFSDLNDLIRESNLSSLVLIVDCCHAGSFLERTLLESTLTAFKEKQDYYLMTACRSFERAREGEAHGVFTAAVLQGLQADNADSEGAVTGDRLFDFIQRELRQSGQEPIRTGTGRSIPLVNYQPQGQKVTAIVDEQGEVVCPYQGLQAFTAAQQEFFFGRKRIVEAIKQNLEQQPFVPVIGASGSGKSSVVRAGLMPWLEESGWRILEPIKPGFEPLAALRGVFEPFFKRSRSEIQALHQLVENHDSAGLAGVMERMPGDERCLLIVDQFEELFTVCASESDRQRFIELITQVATVRNARLAVVTTMRADFLEPCLHYPTLHHLIQSQAVFMPPLTGIDLRNVITEPAKRQGYAVEEALLLQILEDVVKEPGFLPLLEFVLTKLWEKRDHKNHRLMLEQYEKLGGLTGALNLHAERVYHYRDYEAETPTNERDEQEQKWIKQIFLRLLRTGEDEKDTRQRQPKANLLALSGENPAQYEVLSDLLDSQGGLVQGRLLVTGNDRRESDWIDLVHEALIDSWQRFAKWRSSDRELRRLRDRLEDDCREWSNHRQSEQFLMTGGRLALVQEQWHNLESELNSEVKSFYSHSEQSQRDKAAEENRQERAVNSLSRYMPIELVKQLIENPNVVKIGGESKEVSVMFCGIRNYINLTETLTAEEFLEIINQYFEIMVDVIFSCGGIIDTYLGGQIVAVFGSPLPLDDHEWMAVQAAQEMRRRLIEFNIELHEKHQLTFEIGIGINSDTVISGNMGSSKHMKFTVTGNGVNLSAELQSVTKLYGTDIVISENTFRPCANRVWARELDYIKMKDKNRPVAIYELVDLQSRKLADSEKLKIEVYHQGRKLYLIRQFRKAMNEFALLVEEIDDQDKSSLLHLDRCQYWLQYPPGEDWDGSWTLK